MIERGAFSQRRHWGFRTSSRQGGVPTLNTAALPDLIFTVLFFFMIVTTMRQVEPLVSYRVPQGKQLTRLVHKSSVTYIYIGRATPSLRSEVGDSTFIQLNDKLATPADIGPFIAKERSRMSAEDRRRQVVCIRADRDVDMGVVADVKMELRKAKATRIIYSATETK